MRSAVLGMLGVATAGAYVVSGGGGVHHERIVNESPQAVYDLLAANADLIETRRIEGFRAPGMRAPDGSDGMAEDSAVKGKTLTFKTEKRDGKAVSIEVLADDEEIADIDFTVEPAADGKTKLGATFDLDGGPVGMKPNFAMLELGSGVMMDELVKGMERGDIKRLVQLDLPRIKGMMERFEAERRGVTPNNPAMGVAMQRREREQAMRDAAKPMVDVSGHNPSGHGHSDWHRMHREH